MARIPKAWLGREQWGDGRKHQGGVYLKEATTSKKLAVSHVVQATLKLAMIAKEDLMPPLPRR